MVAKFKPIDVIFYIGWCYYQLLYVFVADLIAMVLGWCYCLCFLLVVDVVTTLEFLIIHVEIWQMLMSMPFFFFFVADGITIYVEDGKPHFLCFMLGRCYCHGGRWNSHLRWVMIGTCYCRGDWCYCHWSAISILVLTCSTEPHPICVADGICLHSC